MEGRREQEQGEASSGQEWRGLAAALQLDLLETLDLSRLALTRLQRFPALPGLTKLDISGNKLTGGLEALECCPNLEVISLEDNLLNEVKTLEPLKRLKHLKQLCIKGNPFLDRDYGKRARELLPTVMVLDDSDTDCKEEQDETELLIGILPKLGF